MKFQKVTSQHKDTIFEWLDSDHVKEFWDNSQNHRDDILIFMDNRKEPSSYFNGMFTYWIGSEEGEPYCFIMTAEVRANDGSPQIWEDNLSKTGKTYSIDYCIGNKKYLGRGLGAKTLECFVHYFNEQVDNKADTFFIDPNEDNPRAKRVYEKAGFVLVDDYAVEEGFFKGHRSYLMVKKLLTKGNKG